MRLTVKGLIMEFTGLKPCLITSLPLPDFAKGVIFLGAKGENMKKIIAITLSLALLIVGALSAGCQKSPDAVAVKYFSSAPDMLPMLKKGELTVGLLPEPAATQLTKVASDKTWYRMDVQELYDDEVKAYPQAVMLVKSSLLSTFPNLVSDMASKFSINVAWVKENAGSAVGAVNSHLESGATPSLNASVITSQVVDNCKIYWQGAADAAQSVKDYIDAIMDIDEMSAKAVSDDLFYSGTASGTFTSDAVKVVAPDGAPALAIAKFISDNESFNTGKTFNYSVVSANKIGAAVQQGTGDIVILPVNAASKLYAAYANDTYKLVSVVTHGNLYIMSSEEISDVTELKEKTIGVIGQGLVPDLTLKAVFAKYNLVLEAAI